MSNRICRRIGFTLIEMLLVVAILSLLIALLLPSLAHSKHVAQTVVCASNVGQIYKAAFHYAHANLNLLPNSRQVDHNPMPVPEPTPKWVAWVGDNYTNIDKVRQGTLYSYMGKNEAAYLCPVFVATPRSLWLSPTAKPVFSYTMNEYTGNSWNGKAGIRWINRAQEPSKLLLFSEENPWKIAGMSTAAINNGALGVGSYGAAGSITDCISTYHFPANNEMTAGSGNVAFFDGHVDLIDSSQSKEVATPRRYKF